MTTHGFADLPRDPKVMRARVEHAGDNLGAYARVEEPGEIQVDDPIEILG
jgi:MOSC domain-containing protein YiiM